MVVLSDNRYRQVKVHFDRTLLDGPVWCNTTGLVSVSDNIQISPGKSHRFEAQWGMSNPHEPIHTPNPA